MKQIIFIDGFSGIGKTTLAKKLFKHYRSTYIEQNMIPEFISKTGGDDVKGSLEEKTLFTSIIVLIKNFCKLGYKNIIALDFDGVRFRDIPEKFKGYNFIILRLICDDIEQNKKQMKNRGKGLIDIKMLDENYNREKIFTRPILPNEHYINVTNKTPKQVFDEAVETIDKAETQFNYKYKKPNKKYFNSWVKTHLR